MPYLRVRLACQKSNQNIKQIVAKELTHLAVTKLKKDPNAATVDIKLCEPEDWFIAGKPISQTNLNSFYLEIKITSGTNTREEKSQFVQASFAKMQELIRPLATTSYIVIQDVASDSWGFGGKTQEWRYITNK